LEEAESSLKLKSPGDAGGSGCGPSSESAEKADFDELSSCGSIIVIEEDEAEESGEPSTKINNSRRINELAEQGLWQEVEFLFISFYLYMTVHSKYIYHTFKIRTFYYFYV
jgi:hypothetical protein